MQPKLQSRDKNRDLFREELIDILDMSHNLCVTADLLDWSLFREAFDKEFPSKTGRPATPSRLIAGLLYLKALYNLSDEQLVLKTPIGSISAESSISSINSCSTRVCCPNGVSA